MIICAANGRERRISGTQFANDYCMNIEKV